MALSCLSPSGTQEVAWLRDGVAVTASGHLSLSSDNGTLTLQPAQRGDSGAYACRVSNAVSANRSDDVNVTVLCESPQPPRTPRLSLSPHPYAIPVLSPTPSLSLHAPCLSPFLCPHPVPSPRPQPRPTSVPVSIPVPLPVPRPHVPVPPPIHALTVPLSPPCLPLLPPLTPGPADGPDAVTVTPPGPLRLALGSLLELHCAAPAVPAPVFSWVHGNRTLATDPHLRLQFEDPSQAGGYRCRATNPALGRAAEATVLLLLLQDQGERGGGLGAGGGRPGTGVSAAAALFGVCVCPPPGLASGAVAGVVVGTLLGLALLVATGYGIWRCVGR